MGMGQSTRNRDFDIDRPAPLIEAANALEAQGWHFDSASPYDSEERSGPYLRYAAPRSGRVVSIGPDGITR